MKLHVNWPLMRKGYRSLATEYRYVRYRRDNTQSCKLCKYTQHLGADDVVTADRHWLVIKNKFPYKTWDFRPVVEHLMLIPTQHHTQLNQLTDLEWRDLQKLLSRYDHSGYSTYLRSVGNQLKTLPHLHWHLIKIR